MRLIAGDLRQGALEGVLVDAVARAADLPAARVRRATMLAGALAPVARVALDRRRRGAFALPSSAVSTDPADARRFGRRRRRCDDDARRGGARIQTRRRAHPGAQGRRRGARVLAKSARRDDRRSRSRGPGPRASRARDDSRRRGDRARVRAALLIHFRSPCGGSGGSSMSSVSARSCRSRRSSSTCCISMAIRCVDEPLARRMAVLADRLPAAEPRAAHRHGECETSRPRSRGEALAAGHEGVMAKSVDGLYAAGRRGSAWLKVKQAHTLDLVDPCRGVGKRPAPGHAEQPASRARATSSAADSSCWARPSKG